LGRKLLKSDRKYENLEDMHKIWGQSAPCRQPVSKMEKGERKKQ
jgi:hypothetical protein